MNEGRDILITAFKTGRKQLVLEKPSEINVKIEIERALLSFSSSVTVYWDVEVESLTYPVLRKKRWALFVPDHNWFYNQTLYEKHIKPYIISIIEEMELFYITNK